MNAPAAAMPLLEVRQLAMHFPVTEGIVISRRIGDVKAVDGVDFKIERGETSPTVASLHLFFLGWAMLFATLPLHVEEARKWQVGWVVGGAFGVASFLTRIPSGRLADRWGRRPVMLDPSRNWRRARGCPPRREPVRGPVPARARTGRHRCADGAQGDNRAGCARARHRNMSQKLAARTSNSFQINGLTISIAVLGLRVRIGRTE